MLIITADDLGRDTRSTDACMECFRQNRITSASIMVLMHDSERAAELATQEKLETGLHINLVLPYDSPRVTDQMHRAHRSAVRFFRAGPWTQVIYNPFITKAVTSTFQMQIEEYWRLFGKAPVFLNGHKHFHLSLNMIFGKVLPLGAIVRRSFTFQKGEKNWLNRRYRRLVDAWLEKRFVTTDGFFSLSPVEDLPRLRKIFGLARNAHVELMAHPWRKDESVFLSGNEFQKLTADVRLAGFASLRSNGKHP
jgi:predicted glycoside hydrolase/deacetylase ChbG (UPF0249 family)